MNIFEFLKYMVEEEHLALDKLIQEATEKELNSGLLENDETSIRDRIIHTLGAEYRMAGYLFPNKNDTEFESSIDTKEGLLQASQKSKQRHFLTLDNLTVDDLNRSWTSKVSGKSYTYKFLLWHFIEHIATHRGQVAMGLRRVRE